jgi:drug/metabolite transporter (DMT)-like permease
VIALLPLIAGILLARLVTRREVVIGVEVALFALAAIVLVSTAPDHGNSHAAGALMAAVLAPLCALTVVLGTLWRGRTQPTPSHADIS